jgi:hypothetical protein
VFLAFEIQRPSTDKFLEAQMDLRARLPQGNESPQEDYWRFQADDRQRCSREGKRVLDFRNRLPGRVRLAQSTTASPERGLEPYQMSDITAKMAGGLKR